MPFLCVSVCRRQRGLLQGKLTLSGAEPVHAALLDLHNAYQVGVGGGERRGRARSQLSGKRTCPVVVQVKNAGADGGED